MTYVYLLNSVPRPRQQDIGLTDRLRERILDHNRGDSLHTAKFAPWRLVAYFAFAERKRAIAFERYLKSGSGRALLKRHVFDWRRNLT
jgi:putative endonuclease